MTEFVPYPKTPRLFRDIVITEKIDGTNAGIQIRRRTDEPVDGKWWFEMTGAKTILVDEVAYAVTAQSRKRIVTPDDDNFGFAKWVYDNAGRLVLALGEGTHFGEWWGSGIQRGYGLTKGEKRFSLFNAKRFENADLSLVPGLGVVPVLKRYTFNTGVIDDVLATLRAEGSVAAPGFMNPEGIIVFHSASGQVFKVLLENDETPKGLVA